MKTLIFVSHPFASAPGTNVSLVRSIARRLALEGQVPIAPQLYLPAFLDETTQRDLAMKLCLGLLALCDEVRVYGEPSAGMLEEIAEAKRLGIPVVRGEEM